MIRIAAAAAAVLLFPATLLTGCSVFATDEAPDGPIQISAPPLVDLDPYVDAAVPAPVRSPAPARARRIARAAALEVLIPSCDDDPTGRGFAVGAHTLVAHRDVIEGGGWVRVSAGKRSTAVGAGSAYRVGDLAVARVPRALPRALPLRRSVGSGVPVVVVTERNGKLRMLPGVVVDSVAGAPHGVRTPVLRLTSLVREDDVGPVLDAKGRIVGVLFGVDERTTLGLAIPATSLRGLVAKGRLEPLDACD